MKAISLWQPWAHFMALGLKEIETRSWATTHRGPLAIHAAKRPLTNAEFALLGELEHTYDGFDFSLADLSYGHIVAVVDLVDCKPVEDVRRRLLTYGDDGKPDGWEMEHDLGNYSDGRFAWITDTVLGQSWRRLERPIPFIGRQGLFNVPDDITYCASIVNRQS